MWKWIIGLALLALIAYVAVTLYAQFGHNPKLGSIASKGDGKGAPFQNGLFDNAIPTPTMTGDVSGWTFLKEMVAPSSPNRKPPAPLPHVKTPLQDLSTAQDSLVWFGHSSYLLTMNGQRILVDPVFSGHASPLPFAVRSFAGTDAYTANDMPPIDVLLITHDHYDHLDYETVKALKNKVKHVIAPLGVGSHLQFWGYAADRITELDWHQSAEAGGVQITATPARHFSGRSFDRNRTLWASYVVQGAQSKVYVGGDSGYGPHFAQIGEQYGPFDLALLECGQYNLSWKHVHMMPEETAKAAQDLKATSLMPVHWGKFILSLHDWDEPMQRVTAAAKQLHQNLLTPQIGVVVPLQDLGAVPTPPASTSWWHIQR